MKKFQRYKFQVTLGLILGLAFAASVSLSAFQLPTQAPPGGNVGSSFLNTGGTSQEKFGGLILNSGGAATGLVVYSGNVGISTGATTPTGKLQINSLSGGNPTYRGNLILENSAGGLGLSNAMGIEFKAAGGGNGYGWRISNPDLLGGNTPLVFESRTANVTWTERARMSSAGNLGIGTPDPQSKLTVSGITDGSIRVINTGAGNSELKLYDTTDGGWALFSQDGILRIGEVNTGGSWTENDLALDRSGNLSVGGYTQLALTSGAPPAADCDDASEYGRMKVDSAAGLLYICAASGWISK